MFGLHRCRFCALIHGQSHASPGHKCNGPCYHSLNPLLLPPCSSGTGYYKASAIMDSTGIQIIGIYLAPHFKPQRLRNRVLHRVAKGGMPDAGTTAQMSHFNPNSSGTGYYMGLKSGTDSIVKKCWVWRPCILVIATIGTGRVLLTRLASC